MYMVFFASLIAVILGSYASIYTRQSTRIHSMQSGVVDAMLDWHATALSQAMFNIRRSSITTTGCELTWRSQFAPSLSMLPCDGVYPSSAALPSWDGVWSAGGAGAVLCSSNANVLPCFTPLPTGYATVGGAGTQPRYSFYSVAFSNASRFYVITYVPPPPTGNDPYNLGYLCLPGNAGGTIGASCNSASYNTVVSITMNDFYRLLGENPRVQGFTYGRVSTPALPSLGTFTPGQYRVSTDFNVIAASTILPNSGAALRDIPAGSIGILTEIAPCPATACP